MTDSTESYPVLRIPEKGCIIRTHRYGKSKLCGYKEEEFQQSILNYFGTFEISGSVRMNTGSRIRQFEPDIAIIDKITGKNLRIDIEIDEPYASITRHPQHCRGDDVMRDIYFANRGWIVIRFSEYQVHIHELGCLKYIASVIKSIAPECNIPTDLINTPCLVQEKLWNEVQSQKWVKENYRETYLNHILTAQMKTNEEAEDRKLNAQEQIEEEEVISSLFFQTDDEIGYNKKNKYSPIFHRLFTQIIDWVVSFRP